MMKRSLASHFALLISALSLPLTVFAADSALVQAKNMSAQGQHFSAARYAYSATETAQGAEQADAFATVTTSLIKAGLYQSSSYFFLKTLETKDKPAIRKVLVYAEPLMDRLGGDTLRDYLIRYTELNDYAANGRSAYLFSLGKAALLKGEENKALQYLNSVSTSSPLYPRALQLRGTALAIQGRNEESIDDFRDCVQASRLVVTETDTASNRYRQQIREKVDLEQRCLASQARVYYQADRFEDAEKIYDKIPKDALIWPDILFEQAWNSFARREFNRSLGKLVTYKSPMLSSIFNSENDVLQAQSYLSLCLYDDVNETVDRFQAEYSELGRDVKRFVEQNESNLPNFYALGVQTAKSPFNSKNNLHRMTNRFIRGPYFYGLMTQDRDIAAERGAIASFAQMTQSSDSAGLAGFLKEVLGFRTRTVRNLGGAFVRNSLIDHQLQLVADFEKMSFIRIEMLSRAKDKLVRQSRSAQAEEDERKRGAVIPNRRDYQMFWTFNGEFWRDELGDYVFGLQSECGA